MSEGSNLSGVSARCAWEEGAESDWDDDDDDEDNDNHAGKPAEKTTKSSPAKKVIGKCHNKDASPRQLPPSSSSRPPQHQQHPQHDSDPNEDIEDSDEFDDDDEDDDDDDDDDDVPLGAEGVFPESDSEDERNDSIR